MGKVARLLARIAQLGAVVLLGSFAVALTAAALVPQAGQLLDANSSSAAEVDLTSLELRSIVYDANGQEIAQLNGPINREEVGLDEISDEAIKTILAVEDADFYIHNGINVRSVVRALIQNVNAGGVEQGGSTITQQLVKNSALSSDERDQRDLDRKVPEAAMALRLERQMTKDEILERYLNTVYFGGGAYGVEAAAELYFDTTAAELDWVQSAMLASLISSPVSADPTLNPETALVKRRSALDRLVDEEHLTAAEADLLDREPLPRNRRSQVFALDERDPNYFVEEVKQALFDDERLGATRDERIARVFSGGLRIYTTLDPDAQAQAEEAVAAELPPNDEGFTAALASVQPGTGAVRAIVGGPGWEEFSQFNLATQKGRPTGSSFKTFVLAAAMQAGYSPNDRVSGSSPCEFENPRGTPDPYRATNFGGSRGSSAGTIRSQTLSSSNCAYLRLGQIVGLTNVIETAEALGVDTSLMTPVLSLPLGVFDITPLDMATAYATIANDGVRFRPYYIERVEDRQGRVIFEHEGEGVRAISVQAARLVQGVLEGNVQGGTGTRARLAGQPAGGKTGTAQDFGNAWFVGFTPYLATAVWMGHPDGEVPMRNVGGRSVTGGSYPAQIWGHFMNAYHAGRLPVPFLDPPDRLPSPRTLRTTEEQERFVRGQSASPCGSTRAEIDNDGDGTVDACQDLGGTTYRGSCPALLVPTDTDGDGTLDRCVAAPAPTPAPDPPPPTTPPAPPPSTPTTEPPPTTTAPPATTTTVSPPPPPPPTTTAAPPTTTAPPSG